MREAALAVGSTVGFERRLVCNVVKAAVDVSERELSPVAAVVGLDALAVSVARGDSAPVLGALDAVDVLAVGEAAVAVRLATVLEDRDAAARDAVRPDGD